MRSKIYAAYVAGLCPMTLLMDQPRPDRYPVYPPAANANQTGGDPHRSTTRRRRTLLSLFAIGLALGALQLLSRLAA